MEFGISSCPMSGRIVAGCKRACQRVGRCCGCNSKAKCQYQRGMCHRGLYLNIHISRRHRYLDPIPFLDDKERYGPAIDGTSRLIVGYFGIFEFTNAGPQDTLCWANLDGRQDGCEEGTKKSSSPWPSLTLSARIQVAPALLLHLPGHQPTGPRRLLVCHITPRDDRDQKSRLSSPHTYIGKDRPDLIEGHFDH